MAEHAQIDVRRGTQVVRIHSGWGIPSNVLPALRRAAAKGAQTPQTVAKQFMQLLGDSSFGLSILDEDFQRDALSFYYTVDVSTMPWTVVQTKMPGHKITVRDGVGFVSPTLSPARKRTIRIGNAATK